MTQRSGVSLIIQDTPAFLTKGNNKQIWRNKLWAYFLSLTLFAINDKIIVDYIRMAMSKTFYTSITVANLAKDILPNRIAIDEKF